MAMSYAYFLKKPIAQNDKWALFYPFNTQDMNYHLVNLKTEKDYLVDIEDVVDTEEELDEYGEITWADFIDLDNVERNVECAWKVIDMFKD